MGKLRFAKVLTAPVTKVPGTIYIVPKQNGTADLVITSDDGASSKTIEGFTQAQIKDLSLLAVLTGLDATTAADVVASDSVIAAIGKLQAQARLFGQGVEGQAIFSATEFTSVPTEYKARYIVVIQPHLRMMAWDGSKYIRAPWNQPGIVIHSYDNPVSIPGYLPIRGDITYQQANYPDLVSRLGLSGTGTFSLIEARGEFIRALDNGRGVDVSRVIRTAQGDAIRNITAEARTAVLRDLTATYNVAATYGTAGAFATSISPIESATAKIPYEAISDGATGVLTFNASWQVPTSNENRPRNIAFPLWVSY